MKFKTGDKVRVAKQGVDWLDGMNEYIGKEGVIRLGYNDCCYWVAGIEKNYIGYNLTIGKKDIWYYFCEDSLELAEPTVPILSTCPRCSGEMVEKQTADYGMISKCRNCGYC